MGTPTGAVFLSSQDAEAAQRICGALRSAGVVHNSVTDITGQGDTPAPDLNETSWKAGVRPLEWLAMEADYIDLGSNTVGERLAA